MGARPERTVKGTIHSSPVGLPCRACPAGSTQRAVANRSVTRILALAAVRPELFTQISNLGKGGII